MTIQPIDRLLRAHPFADGLDDSSVAFLASCMKNERFSAGSYLFREGDPADTLFLVRQGHVALQVHAPGRGSVQVESIGPGDVLGWSTMFPPHAWHVDARVLETTVALTFVGKCLRDKMATDTALAYAVTRRLLYEVHRRLERVRLQQADVYAKVP